MAALEVGQERDCNGCTVCCKLVQVEEIQKPQWKQCGFCADKRCQVYDTPQMPSVCKDFECVWLSRPDLLPLDAQRPDKLGIMLMETDSRLLIIEAWPAGFRGPDVLRSVKHVTESLNHFAERPLAVGNAMYIEPGDPTLCKCDCHQTDEAGGLALVQHTTSCCWTCPACSLNVKHQYAQDHRRSHQKDEEETRG